MRRRRSRKLSAPTRQLIKQGKVRAIGASNLKPDRLAAALEASRKSGLPAYQTLQPNYSLIERAEYENNLEPLCAKEGLGVINYFPLGGRISLPANTVRKAIPRGKHARVM